MRCAQTSPYLEPGAAREAKESFRASSRLRRLAGIAAIPAMLAFATVASLAPCGAQEPAGDARSGPDGGTIYREHCASCHGAQGEGVPGKCKKPLAGRKSLPTLIRYIERRMPKGEPDKVTGNEAKAVGRFVWDAFYSPIAQARKAPPRVELARLTVRQFRQAAADLLGTFRPSFELPPERGLEARYYNSHRPQGREAARRIDPRPYFFFARRDPPPEGVDPEGFSARWEGSLLAPATGRYEIAVRTNQAARLWLNDFEEPLIDAWVKSGNEEKHAATVFLLDGRAYPLRLEFSSRHQGVQNRVRKKPGPVEARIELWWRLPGRVEEPVPSRYLVPVRAPQVFVLETAFPPDDRSMGYERGTSVSKEWEEAVAAAALETARYVLSRKKELAGLEDASPPEAARAFLERFVERAFRHPLTPEERRLYIERQIARAESAAAALRRSVAMTIASPRFLFVDFRGGANDPYKAASALSFALWDSLPDAELLEQAKRGKLRTFGNFVAEALRMVRDPRARAKLREFLDEWLEIRHAGEIAKDPKRFPAFDAALVNDLRRSLDIQLEEWLSSPHPDLRELLAAGEYYVSPRIAEYYGFALEGDGAGFRRAKPEAPARRGILTHPFLLARFAYSDTSSPIHRGVFLIRQVFGEVLLPPPVAVAPLPADLHPDMTTRERVEEQTKPEACRSCHDRINPAGFTLEVFDADGRYRTKENGKPVDASGAYVRPDGDVVKFRGPEDLIAFLAGSEEVARAFAVRLFEHLVKQPIQAYGPRYEKHLLDVFRRSGYDVRRLAAEIAACAGWYVLTGGEDGLDHREARF